MSAWDIFVNGLWGWKRWTYPPTPKLPLKPWHPDGDVAFTSTPTRLHPDSAQIIAHLRETSPTPGGIIISTGSTLPGSGGIVPGYPLNLAQPSTPLYWVSHDPGAGNVWISTGWQAPYGKRLAYKPTMMIQGNPAQDYSDHKLHVYDPAGGTITECGEFWDRGNNSLEARKVTQTTLSAPSGDARGCSVAKLPLAELTLRFDDLIVSGWVQRASMGIVAASSAFIAPALGSDGHSTAPFAPPMGTVLRLKEAARTRLTAQGCGRGTNPQANAVMDCYSGPGIMIVDSGGNNSTMLEPDSRWNQTDLAALKKLTIDDFDVWAL
jgi:hypothetical protein